jgi:hypothetical protein
VIERLLMVAGGGASYIAPVLPTPITFTDPADGGWTQIPEDRAVYHNGYTYASFVAGDTGDVGVAWYENATGTRGVVTGLHGSALDSPPDTHDCPGLIVRSTDNKLVVAYSHHNGSTIWRRISTTSLDTDPDLSDGFASEGTVIGSGTFTYPILVQRNAETNDPIYCWFRSGANDLRYVKSTDGGSTWSGATTVYSGSAPYWKIICDGEWRIDFFVSSANPDVDSSVGHFYADDEDYKLSDGTPIGGLFPFTFGEITEVEGGGIQAWWTDAMYDEDGQPAGVYGIDNGSGTDSSFKYARWDGAAWVDSEIIASVGAGVVDPAPVATVDAVNPTHVHLTRFTGGQFEIWRYLRSGDTWDAGTAITSGSTDPNIYPTSVKGHPDGELAILWLNGVYTGSEIGIDLGILGITD